MKIVNIFMRVKIEKIFMLIDIDKAYLLHITRHVSMQINFHLKYKLKRHSFKKKKEAFI